MSIFDVDYPENFSVWMAESILPFFYCYCEAVDLYRKIYVNMYVFFCDLFFTCTYIMHAANTVHCHYKSIYICHFE